MIIVYHEDQLAALACHGREMSINLSIQIIGFYACRND